MAAGHERAISDRRQDKPNTLFLVWPWPVLMLAAVCLPIILAALMASRWGFPDKDDGPPPVASWWPVTVATADELAGVFAAHDYSWPPEREVPPLIVQTLPPDLDSLPIAEKKVLFFQALLPLVLLENARLAAKREWLSELQWQQHLGEQELARLQVWHERYKLDSCDDPRAWIEALLFHIDQVPEALVLAQAANESGWGSSRFVLEGNNLFGEWTWDPDQGIAPKNRRPDSRHYVRRFDQLLDSVRSYMHNLNAGHAYTRLRRMRAQMRAEGQRLDALELASGLLSYSARGEEYVAEIQAMIRGNRLHQLDIVELAGADQLRLSQGWLNQ